MREPSSPPYPFSGSSSSTDRLSAQYRRRLCAFSDIPQLRHLGLRDAGIKASSLTGMSSGFSLTLNHLPADKQPPLTMVQIPKKARQWYLPEVRRLVPERSFVPTHIICVQTAGIAHLAIRTLDVPQPAANQVLVKIHAVSLNVCRSSCSSTPKDTNHYDPSSSSKTSRSPRKSTQEAFRPTSSPAAMAQARSSLSART